MPKHWHSLLHDLAQQPEGKVPPVRDVLTPPLRTAFAADAAGFLLLVLGGLIVAAATAERSMAPAIPTGLQLVTALSLVGAVVTADKAVRRGRKAMIDVLGAFSWGLALTLTPVAMIQTLQDVLPRTLPVVHLVMLLWLCLHGAVATLLGAIAILRRLQGPPPDSRMGDLVRLSLFNRWVGLAGGVALLFPYAVNIAAAP